MILSDFSPLYSLDILIFNSNINCHFFLRGQSSSEFYRFYHISWYLQYIFHPLKPWIMLITVMPETTPRNMGYEKL